MTTESGKRNILVPLDGSELAEQAIPYAAAGAGADGDVTYLIVTPSVGSIRDLWGNVVSTVDDVTLMEQNIATDILKEIAERWKEVVPAPRLEIRSGDPAETILATCAEVGADMISMASHGRGAIGRAAFGSVADRITRTSTLPVMIVNPQDEFAVAGEQITRILVPIDGSELSMESLPVAIELAGTTRAPVHLVQAISPGSVVMTAPMAGGYYPADLINEIESELVAGANDSLAAARQVVGNAGVDVTTEVIEGGAANAIASTAQPGDLIVMSSHGRGGVTRWLLGSVSEKLVRSGVAPVVLVPASTRVETSESGG